MDNMNRWAIGLGAGIFTGMLILGGHYAATASVMSESFSDSVDRLIPRYISLDATIELDTFSARTYAEMSGRLHELGVNATEDCGGYLNPAHPCVVDATLPDALRLRSVIPGVVRDSYSLTIGEYRSDVEDVLTSAATVKVDTGTGLRPLTYEGNGTFTLAYLGRSSMSGNNEDWQYALAAVPVAPVWLAVGAVASTIAVLVAGCFRPRRDPEVETVGIEFFDQLHDEG